MHWVGEAIVRDGKLVLTGLPFADGQHVDVVISELAAGEMAKRLTIDEVRTLLRNSVKQYDDPFGPAIPTGE